MHQKQFSLQPIKLYSRSTDKNEDASADPFSIITGAMAKIETGECAVLHIDFTPLSDDFWRHEKKLMILSHTKYPNWFKKIFLNNYGFISVLFYPFRFLFLVFGSS